MTVVGTDVEHCRSVTCDGQRVVWLIATWRDFSRFQMNRLLNDSFFSLTMSFQGLGSIVRALDWYCTCKCVTQYSVS